MCIYIYRLIYTYNTTLWPLWCEPLTSDAICFRFAANFSPGEAQPPRLSPTGLGVSEPNGRRAHGDGVPMGTSPMVRSLYNAYVYIC